MSVSKFVFGLETWSHTKELHLKVKAIKDIERESLLPWTKSKGDKVLKKWGKSINKTKYANVEILKVPFFVTPGANVMKMPG